MCPFYVLHLKFSYTFRTAPCSESFCLSMCTSTSFARSPLFAHIAAVTGKVEGDQGGGFMLRQQPVGKPGGGSGVFVAAEAVAENHQGANLAGVPGIELAADIEAGIVDFEIPFHGAPPEDDWDDTII